MEIILYNFVHCSRKLADQYQRSFFHFNFMISCIAANPHIHARNSGLSMYAPIPALVVLVCFKDQLPNPVENFPMKIRQAVDNRFELIVEAITVRGKRIGKKHTALSIGNQHLLLF